MWAEEKRCIKLCNLSVDVQPELKSSLKYRVAVAGIMRSIRPSVERPPFFLRFICYQPNGKPVGTSDIHVPWQDFGGEVAFTGALALNAKPISSRVFPFETYDLIEVVATNHFTSAHQAA